MTFGSPLTAGPAVTSPNTLVDAQIGVTIGAGATVAFPSSSTTYDVSAFTGILLDVISQDQQLAVTVLAKDQTNNSIEANDAGANLQLPAATTLLMYQRSLGPGSRVLVFNPGGVGATLTFRLWGTSQTYPFDGPYTPGYNGYVLASIAFAAAIGGQQTASVQLAPGVGLPSLYAGPATLSVFGAGGAPCGAYVRSLAPLPASQIVGGVQGVAPATGSLGIGTQGETSLWLPTGATQLVATNGGTAQTVQATVIASS